MIKQRIPETDNGIIGEILVQDYDDMQRKLRNRGLLETRKIIKAGITKGRVLEIGPGPGYLGLEWLKKYQKASLYWLEISQDMLTLAKKNAKEYGLMDRVLAHLGDVTNKIPFDDNYFDGVFTANSLHEWKHPLKVLNEIERVLKIDGTFFIGDLKRNTNPFVKLLMRMNLKKKVMKQGLDSSINAAYTKDEILVLLKKSDFKRYDVIENAFGLSIFGKKN